MTRELNPQGHQDGRHRRASALRRSGLFSSFETLNLAHYNALLISARKDLATAFSSRPPTRCPGP